MEKAFDLDNVLDVLDPEQTLRGEDLDKFYVERSDSPLNELLEIFLTSSTPTKILFTGHRGSGKSTELQKLTKNLLKKFHVISFSIKDNLNLSDLNYLDIILSMLFEAINFMTSPEIALEIPRNKLEEIQSFALEITRETHISFKKTESLNAGLNANIFDLKGKYRHEHETRRILRDKVKPRLKDLIFYLQMIAKDSHSITGKKVMLIIEDLDKTNLETANDLFYKHGSDLASPELDIIYTFPIELRHDKNIAQIRNYFPNCFTLPNLKTRHKNGKDDVEGIKQFKKIITNRIDKKLISDDALGGLARATSGIPRELIALSRQAFLKTKKANKSIIDAAAVKEAIRFFRLEYQILMTQERKKALKTVFNTKDINEIEDQGIARELLHLLAIAEYRNDEVWYDVNPIIRTLVEEIKR